VTNVDGEHMDHYGTMDALFDAFVGFVNRVPFYGMAIVCADDPNVRAMLPRLHKRVVTYGFSPGADYVASDVTHGPETTRFRVSARGVDQGVFAVRMPGLHNVLNALATIALCDEQEIPADTTRKALAEFAGVQRRFSPRGEHRGVRVFDDYGHHPTEIRATLAGARARYSSARVVAIVQPHRYTRLRDTFADFPASLDDANLVIVTEVYAAGEAAIPGVDGRTLMQRLRERIPEREVRFVPAVTDLAAKVAPMLHEGDVVITLGAGNITKVSHELVALLDATP
jgi:UDP-N-acetylmuramate--alanine ligase